MAAIECCCYFYPIKHKFGQTHQPATDMNLNKSSARPGAFEEIELKCYTLPDNRLLLDSDRRFRLLDPRGLVKSRPIEHLNEARHLLDARQATGCSLIRLKVDPKSGQVEERLSIVEVVDTPDQLDDVGLSVEGPTDAHEADVSTTDGRNMSSLAELSKSEVNLIERKRQRQRQIAERLSSRSFVLVERNSVGAIDWLQQPEGPAHDDDDDDYKRHQRQTDDFDESWRSINSITVISQPRLHQTKLVESTKLRDDFLSSIEMETSTNKKVASGEEELKARKPAVDKSKLTVSTRIKKSLKRKLNRLLFGSSSGPTSNRQLVIASDESKQIKYSNLCKQQEQNNINLQCDEPQLEEKDDDHDNDQGGWQLVERRTAELTRFEPPETRPPVRKLLAMISYNHNEAHEYARSLHAALERQGIPTYLDVFEIRKGADWQDSLNVAILNCRLFIPLITPAYGETLWTRRELKLADVLGKLIIPVNFLDASQWPPKSLAIQFATLQYISWLSNGDGHHHPGGCGTRWPAECVESIAWQIRHTIEVDLLDEFKLMVGKDHQPVEPISSRSSSSASSSVCSSSCSSFSSSVAPHLRASHTNEQLSSQIDSGYDSPETTGLLVARKSVRLPLLRLDGQTSGHLAAGNSNYYGSLPESPTRSQASCSPTEPSTAAEQQVDFGRPSQKAKAVKSPKVAKRKNSIGRALGALSKIKRTFKSK